MPKFDIKRKIEEDFIQTCKLMFNNLDGLSILVPSNDKWSVPHPNKELNVLLIKIEKWALENSKITNETIEIVTAFGDVESTAKFNWSEVIALYDLDLQPLLVRAFEPSGPRKNFSIIEHLGTGE